MKNYTQIPNEIMEVLARTHLSDYESRYIWLLLRKTYGFHKKKDYISNSQFVKGTGITKQHIWHTQEKLLWRKIVAQIGYKVSLNKKCSEWRRLPKYATSSLNRLNSSLNKSNSSLDRGTQKKRPKEIIQKKHTKEESENLNKLISEFSSNEKEKIISLLEKFGEEQLLSAVKLYLTKKDHRKIISPIAYIISLCNNKAEWKGSPESEAEQELDRYPSF